MTIFNMLWFERISGQQPESYQEESEQKLLSASSVLVAVETRAVMESRRIVEGVGEGASCIASLFAHSTQPTQHHFEMQTLP